MLAIGKLKVLSFLCTNLKMFFYFCVQRCTVNFSALGVHTWFILSPTVYIQVMLIFDPLGTVRAGAGGTDIAGWGG